jgi:hypothetical protein
LRSLRDQLLKVKDDQAKAENFWREARKQHRLEYNASLVTLQEQHAQQLADFDRSFQEILPGNFRKKSVKLLQLREQEKQALLINRCLDAVGFADQANQLESQEMKEQRRQFAIAFRTQREQLIEAQESQRRCFEENWERKKEKFERKKQQEMGILRRTIANFEKKIEEMENDMEIATMGIRKTVRSQSKASRVLRETARSAPVGMSPRVRNVAATRIAKKKVIVRRV